MSQAFVKEEDGQWLYEIAPTMHALMVYLTRENNGVRVYELKTNVSTNGKQIHSMSNGLSYTKDDNGKWIVLL
jgi:hypothetical protein